MHQETRYPNAVTSTSMDDDQHPDRSLDLDLDLEDDKINKRSDVFFGKRPSPLVTNKRSDVNDQNILNYEPDDHGQNGDDQQDENQKNDENMLIYEPGPLYCTDNNPPESYQVCQAKVADWLNYNNNNTYIERKASVKFAISKTQDPSQTGRSTHRAISLNQRPKLSIIAFRKRPVQHSDMKSKHNDKVDNVKLFRNRSEPGRDYCLLRTEPVSPKVSCVGRVGSVRVPGKKAGVWRSFKAAFSNMVQTNKVTKVAA